MKVAIAAIALMCVSTNYTTLVSVCPGEVRNGDFKCIHDKTHRVCAKMVDNKDNICKELSWSDKGLGFWSITGQEKWNWKDQICAGPNPGDSWCICMYATANLIKQVGCENVHINCPATDVSYILGSYQDGGWSLSQAKQCLQRKCVKQRDGRYINRGDT